MAAADVSCGSAWRDKSTHRFGELRHGPHEPAMVPGRHPHFLHSAGRRRVESLGDGPSRPAEDADHALRNRRCELSMVAGRKAHRVYLAGQPERTGNRGVPPERCARVGRECASNPTVDGRHGGIRRRAPGTAPDVRGLQRALVRLVLRRAVHRVLAHALAGG